MEPFTIPAESNLVEVTSAWTPVDTFKQYDCMNKLGSVHTMFWETDRSRSTFQIYCRDDGYFTWRDWPICLTGRRLFKPS